QCPSCEEAIRYRGGAPGDVPSMLGEERFADAVGRRNALREERAIGLESGAAGRLHVEHHVRRAPAGCDAATNACPRLIPPSLAGTCWFEYTCRFRSRSRCSTRAS